MLKLIFVKAIPTIITSILTYSVQIINTAYVGRLGNEKVVAGIGLANMFINAIAFPFFYGMGSALTAFVP